MRTIARLAAILFLGVVAHPAAAVPVLGGQLFYSGGDVKVTSLTSSSGFDNFLRLYDTSLVQKNGNILAESPGANVTFNPGALGFSPGDELVFGIFVEQTGNVFYMGPAARNPDSLFHAQRDGPLFLPFPLSLIVNTEGIDVGFEDILGTANPGCPALTAGDCDYNDLRFFFQGGVTSTPPEPTPPPTPTGVPEPGSLALLGLGVLGLLLARRKS